MATTRIYQYTQCSCDAYLQLVVTGNITMDELHLSNERALRWASSEDHEPVCETLRSNGGITFEDVRTRHKCALRWASLNGQLPIIEFLISFSLTLEDIRDSHISVLQWASSSGHLHIVEWLFSRGLTAEDVRSENNYALRTASENRRFEIIKYLISKYNLNEDDIKESISNEEYLIEALGCLCIGVATKSAARHISKKNNMTRSVYSQ